MAEQAGQLHNDAYLLKDQAPMDLWTFIEQNPSQKYADRVANGGGKVDPAESFEIKPMSNIGDHGDGILQFMLDNKDLATVHYWEDKYFHSEGYGEQQRLPGSIGYNKRNTTEYYWSDNTTASDSIKQLLGKEALATAGMDYDTTQVRLIAYMPGNVCCLHMDHHQSWAEKYAHLNPHIVQYPELVQAVSQDRENRWNLADKNICDKGRVVRRTVCLNDWEWGHFIQFENSYFPKWQAGDVFNVPPCMHHLSANVGIKLKLTMLLTGVEA